MKMEPLQAENKDTQQGDQKQKATKELFIQVMSSIKTERDSQTQERKVKAFKEGYQQFSQGNMQNFKEVILKCFRDNQNFAQNVLIEMCEKYQANQQELDDFLIQNENDPQISEIYKSLFTTHDFNLQLNDKDITEEEMDVIMHFTTDNFDKVASEQTFGKGEEAYVITLAYIACQIYQKFNRDDSEYERATIYYIKRNPSKYQWYQTRVRNAIAKIF